MSITFVFRISGTFSLNVKPNIFTEIGCDILLEDDNIILLYFLLYILPYGCLFFCQTILLQDGSLAFQRNESSNMDQPPCSAPTIPGSKRIKFHFVDAASKTSYVFIPSLLNIIENSLTRAILRSRCIFSITFAASAVLYLHIQICRPL